MNASQPRWVSREAVFARAIPLMALLVASGSGTAAPAGLGSSAATEKQRVVRLPGPSAWVP